MTVPVFVVGVAPRCGTNYLEDVLCVHPDCGLGIPLRENQLLAMLPEFAAIVDDLGERWSENDRWGFLPQHPQDLAGSIGVGLIDFMVSQVDHRRRHQTPPETLPGIAAAFKTSPRYLVSKYPRTTGLREFRRFFPDEKLILLMRDGRAVAESSIRSWGWAFDVAVDGWRKGASDMAAFLDAHPDDPSLFVRYEDMLVDPESQLHRVFSYLDLDPTRFDLEQALDRPVRGSSTTRPEGTERVDWEPVAKTAEFGPLARARDWPPEKHARFNHMAGPLSERFGYPLETGTDSAIAPVTNLAKDIALLARKASRPVRKNLGKLLGG